MKYLLLFAALFIFSCSSSFKAAAPNGFATYNNNDEKFKAISSDGVLYRVMAYEQKAEATADFWKEAFLLKMEKTNYTKEEELNLNISGKQTTGYIYSFVNNVGLDYYLVAFVPNNQKIVVAEATAEKEKFIANKASIIEAIEKIEIK